MPFDFEGWKFEVDTNGSINIDGHLSDAEKQEIHEAFQAGLESIHDSTSGELKNFLIQDLLPHIDTLSPEIKGQALLLLAKHNVEVPNTTPEVPQALLEKFHIEDDIALQELQKNLGDFWIEAGVTQMLTQYSEYIDKNLWALSPDVREKIYHSIGIRMWNLWTLVEEVKITQQENPENGPLTNYRWIVNSKIEGELWEVNNKILPSAQLLNTWIQDPQKVHDAESAIFIFNEFWETQDAGQQRQAMSYKISEIEDMFAAELDSDGQFDEWGVESLNQNATLHIDREEDANIFAIAGGKKEELEGIWVLSESDKKLEAETMLYYLCAVGVQCLPYVWAVTGAAADATDIVSSTDATLDGLKAMWLVPPEYMMEKTALDSFLAGAGIVLSLVWLQALAKSKKLATAMKGIKHLDGAMIEKVFESFSAKMWLSDELKDTLKGFFGMRDETLKADILPWKVNSGFDNALNFWYGEAVIIRRTDWSRSIAQIEGFPWEWRVIVTWTDEWGNINQKNVGIDNIQKTNDISPQLLEDIQSLQTGYIIKLKNGNSWYVTSRNWDSLFFEVSYPNWRLEYKKITIDELIQSWWNIDDIVKYIPQEIKIPEQRSIDGIIDFVSKMHAPWIAWSEKLFTKWELIHVLEAIRAGNYDLIDNLTRAGWLRKRVIEAIKITPPEIPLQLWQEIYVKRSNGTVERWWRIEEIREGNIIIRNIQDPNLIRNCDKDELYSLQQIEWWKVELQDVSAEFQRRKLELLKSQEQLPREDFLKLFDGDFWQKNVWNCYFVAAMHSLRQSPDFEVIMRTSIRKVSWWYEVQIPMLSTWKGKSVFIPEWSLEAQQNPNYGRKNKWWGIDNRTHLDPIDGPLWYKVLEMAYIIEKFWGPDRLKAEWGFGSEVLLRMTGDNFVQTKIWSFWIWKSLYEQGWQSSFLDFAKKYDPKRNIATANSIHWEGWHDNSYIIDGIKISHSHAYSIMNINRFTQEITLRNPWVWEKPIVMNYEQFLRAFSEIDGVQINYDALLRNI